MNPGQVSSCVSLIPKKSSPPPKLSQKETLLFLSASVSYLMIPAVESKPKRMMINYTTKAEYYLQKQNQITLIPAMEGKNTPPNKKKNHRKHPARRGSQCMGTPICRTACLPLLLSLLFVLEMEIHSLFFFLQDPFRCCILISGHSNCWGQVQTRPQVSEEEVQREHLSSSL